MDLEARLRATARQGHNVLAPTLDGCAERASQLRDNETLLQNFRRLNPAADDTSALMKAAVQEIENVAVNTGTSPAPPDWYYPH